jgi:hypothetical protein
MHLVVIFGPPAVGKMTVGRALSRATGLPLFHNHMAIEPALAIFPFGSPAFTRIVGTLREQVFREVVQSDLPGLIYTCMWDVIDPKDRAYMDGLCALFEGRGAAVHFAELFAPLEVRLARNRTAERLAAKPSKRDVEASEERLRARELDRTLNTDGAFHDPDRHLLINNTALAPESVAETLIERFGLPRVEPKEPRA